MIDDKEKDLERRVNALEGVVYGQLKELAKIMRCDGETWQERFDMLLKKYADIINAEDA